MSCQYGLFFGFNEAFFETKAFELATETWLFDEMTSDDRDKDTFDDFEDDFFDDF